MLCRALTLSMTLLLAAGCDGGAIVPAEPDAGGGRSDAAPGADAAAPDPNAPDADAPDPDASAAPYASRSVATLTLVDPDGAARAAGAVTFGLPFVEGAVYDGLRAEVEGATVATQVDVLRRHPDGSVRHAVVTFDAPALATGEAPAVELLTSPSGPEPGATLDTLLAGGLDLEVEIVEAGVTYRASAAAALERDHQRWLDGPLVVELRTRSALLDDAGAPHPALLARFDVRFLEAGRARVSLVIENTAADAPGLRTYDVTVRDDAGAVVFERAGLEHHHHARWRILHHAGGAQPAFVLPDPAHLVEARVIPPYALDAPLSGEPGRRVLEQLESSHRGPMGNGLITAYMPTTGGRGDIGMLPDWTALALLTGDPALFAAMLEMGDLAGSFPVHFRDRGTDRPLSIDDHPTLSLHPGSNRHSDAADELPDCASCDSPYFPDAAHQPSLAFVPYLLTGDPYYLDELSYWVGFNFARLNFQYRGQAEGWLHPDQTRGQAWTLRTLAHAAWVAPDDHPERAYFEEKLANNLDWYATEAVGSNALGWWGDMSNLPNGGRPDPLMAPEVARINSPWQGDFLVTTFAWLAELGYERAAITRDWMGGFTVGRFTNPDVFNPYEGAPYRLATIDLDGNEYDTWASMYTASTWNRGGPPPTSFGSTCSYCYPAIARAALVTLVRAGTPDAEEALAVVEAGLPGGLFEDAPTWHLRP